MQRRRPIGAELIEGGVHFRVWAPGHDSIKILIGDNELDLQQEPDGYFSAHVPNAAAGTRYAFRIDDDSKPYPDPASRFQPDGPAGSSEVIDPSAFRWEHAYQPTGGIVLYEMHVGTFTPEGTYAAAIEKLPLLRDVGITVIELMPVNEFPGEFGWGYDGVDLWAPTRLYGRPDDLRAFVDAAHAQHLGVVLDVIYNHFGPEDCYLAQFTPSYFTDKYKNEWGAAINFDGQESRGVREYFTENAAYWIDEFHLDGLRLDATQSIHDESKPHVIRELVDAARGAAGGRPIFVVGENEPQRVQLIEEHGLDALWNDDWHHSSRVALTGRREAYYTDYLGLPHEFASMVRLGFLFQGQRYQWQKQRRGTPSAHLAAERFVCYLQNHDQVANSARGDRIDKLTSPGRLRAMTALLLLQPQTPMLFQGQEWAASKPFLYFADHEPELAANVAKGRREFLSQFPSIDVTKTAPPESRATFDACKLDWSEREQNRDVVDLHRELLALRRDDPVFAARSKDNLEAAVIGDDALILRWFNQGDDRLLLVNLGRDLDYDPAPQPLLAPPHGRAWEMVWASAEIAPVERGGVWWIPAETAVVLKSEPGGWK
jgi:maltooligosyltrehalose trehalohydrolase